MKYLLVLSLSFLFVACGNKANKISSLKASLDDYLPYINQNFQSAKSSAESGEIKWVNTKYPMTLKLYQDGSFVWVLNKLGEGQGEWKFSDGHLELKSRTHFFDMRIELLKLSEESFIFHFRDRFGQKSLPVSFVRE